MWTIPQFKTLFVSSLVVLFVVGSWLNLSGVWIEFPLMVNQLPEGWKLPAVMGLFANIANVGVLIIALVRGMSRGGVTYEIPANIIILTTGTVVLVILAFVWNKTTLIGDTERSTYLIGFSFTLSLVDCTSSVTFLPFLDRYKPVYINAYFLGEALSSLFPALLGIAQGVGQISCEKALNGTSIEKTSPPRFSVRDYFLALSVIMLGSLVSFITLCLTRMGRKDQDEKPTDVLPAKDDISVVELKTVDNMVTNLDSVEYKDQLESGCQMTRREFWISEHGIHLFLCLWTSFLIIGATPSIQSYSLNPYSIEVYHHTIIACQFAYPLMSLLGVVIPTLRPRFLYILTVIGTALFAYTFIAAKLSPCSPLVGKLIGRLIISFCWVLKYCVLYFIRVLLGNYFRRTSGHRGLFWFGVLTQIGSLIGAVIIYVLTEPLQLFEERKICGSYSC